MSKTKVVYLCGPINGCSDQECNDWRDYVKGKSVSPSGAQYFRTLNPMRRDYRGKEKEYAREIVELDKIDVTASDIILVNYDKPSVGTSMEVLYAWERGKYVLVVCKTGTVISPWLLYHSHKIVHSFDDAVKVILELDFVR